MKPSSSSTPSSPNARKKSARAYGSTIAWNETSDSGISSAGDGLTVVVAGGAEEVADHGDVGIEDLRARRGGCLRGSDRLRRGRRRRRGRLRLGELRLEGGDALAKLFLQLIDLLLQRARVRLRLCSGAPRKQQQSGGHGRQAHRGDCSHSDLPNARVPVSGHVRFAPATPEAFISEGFGGQALPDERGVDQTSGGAREGRASRDVVRTKPSSSPTRMN